MDRSRDNEDVRLGDVINGCVCKMAVAELEWMEECCRGLLTNMLSNEAKRTTGRG